ncbi:MAG: sulfatase-like hydrolase/transferase [Bacteroidota bacterium]
MKNLHRLLLALASCLLLLPSLWAQTEPPNFLFVITDDMGVDYTNGYYLGSLRPNTPTLDRLRETGITFENVFATPRCSPSRAAILSGKYGNKTGVLGTPGNLDTSHVSIFKALEAQTNGQYADAVLGKWHISSPADPQHPLDHGADYFMGVMGAMVGDYYAWERTENGQTTVDSTYVTTALTDASIDWINAQTQPWFLWLAHPAPHSPFHTPPSQLYTSSPPTDVVEQYVTMIEAVDTELDRLLKNISDSELDNTLIVFVGDNGTPSRPLQDYPRGRGKGTVYQGGIRVPLIISGARLSRQGERESALIHITDLYATVLELAGAELPGGIYNSLSFDHLLDNADGPTRDYNYSEQVNGGANEYAIRGPQYKLIVSISEGTEEFYDLLNDSLEINDLLLGTLTEEQRRIKDDLEAEAQQIRQAWSCRDHIQNGDEQGIDCGGTYCEPCLISSAQEPMEQAVFHLFPNPSREVLYIRSASSPIQGIRLMTASGATLLSLEEVHSMEEVIDISQLAPQLLFVEISHAEGRVLRKMIKM